MKKLIGVLLLVVLLAGCGAREEASYIEALQNATMAPQEVYGEASIPSQDIGLESSVSERKIIFTGEVTLRVDAFLEAAKAIEKATDDLGGYVSESSLSDSHGYMTLKVPAYKVKGFLSAFNQFGVVVDSRFYLDDVTEHFTDLEIRTKNLEVQITTLRDLLKKDNIKVEDIFKIENEIRRLVNELESYEGQIRSLNSRVTFSEIRVSLTKEVIKEKPSDPTFAYRVSSAFKTGVNGMIELGQIIVIFMAFVLPWTPAILVVTALVLVIKRLKPKKSNLSKKTIMSK